MRRKKTLFFLFVAMLWTANAIAATPILRHKLPYKNFIATLGLGLGVHDVAENKRAFPVDVYGFGLSHLVGEVGFTRVLSQRWDISGDIAIGGMSYGKLFNREADKQGLSGFHLGTNLLFRYLYPLSQNWGLGGQVGIGYEINNADKRLIDIIGLTRPLRVRTGLAVRYTPIDSLNIYGSILYTLKNIGRCNDKTDALAKTIFAGSNAHGLEIPVGVHWQMKKHFGLFTEFTSTLTDFRAKNAGFKESFFLGVSLSSMI